MRVILREPCVDDGSTGVLHHLRGVLAMRHKVDAFIRATQLRCSEPGVVEEAGRAPGERATLPGVVGSGLGEDDLGALAEKLGRCLLEVPRESVDSLGDAAKLLLVPCPVKI